MSKISLINKILLIIFLILLFIFFYLLFKKSSHPELSQKSVKIYSLPVIPGPPYPVKSAYGFLPRGKVLVGELIRRGVPPSLANKWSRLVKNKHIYNVAGDWFLGEWIRDGTPLYFEYYRKGKFIIKVSKGNLEKFTCGEITRVKKTGVVSTEGLYWSLKDSLPGYVVYYIWLALRSGDFSYPIPPGSVWKALYRMKGECPLRPLYFSLTYPDNVTISRLYYPCCGKFYWDDYGRSKTCLFPPVQLSDLIYLNGGHGFLDRGYIFSLFDGYVKRKGRAITVRNGDAILQCKTDGEFPSYLENGKISAGSVLVYNVNKFLCKCNQKLIKIPEEKKKDFFKVLVNYISQF